MEYEITRLMYQDHAKIETALVLLNQSLKNNLGVAESFDKFKWTLTKHLSLEEKSIHLELPTNDSQTADSIKRILHDHETILKMLQGVQDLIDEKKEVDLSSLRDFLKQHRDFEDQFLYPELDQGLSLEARQRIKEKIKLSQV